MLLMLGEAVDTFVDGGTADGVLRLDGGSGTVGMRGIGCLIIVGIVTVLGICGNAGTFAEGDWEGTGVVAELPEELEIVGSVCDMSNIFLAFAMLISFPGTP